MKKSNSLVLLFGVVGFGMSVLMPSMAVARCTGTYYAKEFANGIGEPITGYSLWTFSKDGSVISGSNGEPVVPFGTSQGSWRSAGDNKIKSKTFNFSGPNLNPAYPNVARVEAIFQFDNNCSGTVGAQSKFSVISCPLSEGPLCPSGFPVVTDKPIELTRISGN
ncbi:MAG: hypothetical protein PHE55_03235 [Methylococcaceae bacterium]|nr:hypothetical protein [Methylococcaceae bacterium]